jgi:hypothetical protein
LVLLCICRCVSAAVYPPLCCISPTVSAAVHLPLCIRCCESAAVYLPLYLLSCTSAKCVFVTGSLWECLGVVGPESQSGQIPELTEPIQWPSGAPGIAWERRRQIYEDISGLVTTRRAPGSAGNNPGSTGDKSGSTLNCCRAVWDKQHLLWERC